MKSKIQETLESLVNNMGMSFIVEGIPLVKAKTIEINSLRGLPLEQRLDTIAKYYGYTIIRESNGKRQYNEITVFQKNFLDKKDVPDVSLEEVMLAHKDIRKIFDPYKNITISDTARFQSDFYKQLNKSEIEKLKKGVFIKNLNRGQHDVMRRFILHTALNDLVDIAQGLDEFSRLEGVTRNNRGALDFFAFGSSQGRSVSDYCARGRGLVTPSELNATFETDYITLQDVVQRCQKRGGIKIEMDDCLKEKPLLVINGDKILPERLLLSVAKAYGLSFSQNKIAKKYTISIPKINHFYKDIYGQAITGLPNPLVRFMYRGEGNKYRNPNLPKDIGQLPEGALTRLNFGLEKAIGRSKSINIKQMNYLTRSSLAVSAYHPLLYALISFKYNRKEFYLTQMDKVKVTCEKHDLNLEMRRPSIRLTASISGGSSVAVTTHYRP
jgi:hypothetical protein